MSLNKAMLIGRLGQDPEIRYTQGGAAVCNFTLATNETWNDKSGNKQEKTEWHRIVVFGKQAENVAKYLKKGRQAYVEGRLQTRDWEDRDGNKRQTTEITAQTVQFIDGGSGGNSNRDSGNVSQSSDAPGGFDQSFNDDDIPF